MLPNPHRTRSRPRVESEPPPASTFPSGVSLLPHTRLQRTDPARVLRPARPVKGGDTTLDFPGRTWTGRRGHGGGRGNPTSCPVSGDHGPCRHRGTVGVVGVKADTRGVSGGVWGSRLGGSRRNPRWGRRGVARVPVSDRWGSHPPPREPPEWKGVPVGRTSRPTSVRRSLPCRRHGRWGRET